METRKKLRLAGYNYGQPGAYFVTICTKEKLHLLGTVVGADVLIGPQLQLSELGQQVYDVIADMPGVDTFVVMPNHVHMIVKIKVNEIGPMGTSAPTAALSDVVRWFKRSVTRICGENIWQRSYHDHIIRTEEEHLEIRNYIDTNPAKWTEDCYYREV